LEFVGNTGRPYVFKPMRGLVMNQTLMSEHIDLTEDDADLQAALRESGLMAQTAEQEYVHLVAACAASLGVSAEEQADLDAAIAASLEIQAQQAAPLPAPQAGRDPPAARFLPIRWPEEQGLGLPAAGGGLPPDHPAMAGRGIDGRLLPTASELRAEAAMRRMKGAGAQDGESLPQKRPRSPLGDVCKICLDNPSCMRSLPCGHINTCEACSKKPMLSKAYCITCNVWGEPDSWTCGHQLESRRKCLTCKKWEVSCVRVFMP